MRLNIPIVDLLLLEFIAGVPVALGIVIREVLGEAVLDEKLLVLAQLSQLHFLLHLILAFK